MQETSIKINLDKELFESNEIISGHVLVKTRVPLYIKKITLNFSKFRKMDICKLESPEGPKLKKVSNDTLEYSYDFILYETLDCELSCGAHKFPFKFNLKTMDSSTSEIKGIYFDFLVNVCNSYLLTSSIFLDGIFEPLYMCKKKVMVVDKIDILSTFQTKFELSTIMCLFYKTYTVKFSLNKFLYYSGDQLVLTVAFNKYIAKLVKNIECNLYEVLTIHSSDINFIRTRYIIGGNAQSSKNDFLINFRIPSTTPTCVNEDIFSLKILMFVNITFYNITPIRIKKYLQVVKKQIELPIEDSFEVLNGDTYEEKLLFLK